jgi:hypothetical protein
LKGIPETPVNHKTYYYMKKTSSWLAMLSLVFIYMLGTAPLAAQAPRGDRGGRGNFDPAEMRARMMERMREQLEVKNDDEWKLISGRIEKVTEARREMGNNMRFGGRRGGPGGPGGPGGQGGGRRGFGGEPNPEVEALQKALDSNASSDEIKSKLTALRKSRKANQAALEKAQEDLRKVLTVRQEASALMMGLIN